MNGNALHRHYDKLTPRERYAAKLAAIARADEPEIMALDQTAPKRNYQVTHHYFYQEAWLHLAAVHMVEMLNLGCTFYQGQGVCFLDGGGKWNEKISHVYNLLEQLSKTIIEIDASWRKFCEGERMDPDRPMMNLPGSGVYSADAPQNPLNQHDTIPLLLRAARTVYQGEPDPAQVELLAEDYAGAFHRLAGDQVGGWG